jgi:hypothetical protein
MRTIQKIQIHSILLFYVLSLNACTEIIEIDINSSAPQLVIEANIGSGEYAEVKLTESINLNDENTFPVVEDAIVQLTDNIGNTEVLSYRSAGKYVSTTMRGVEGRSYSLNIESANKKINGMCVIPSAVKIDTFHVIRSIYPGGGPGYGIQPERFFEISLSYKDPLEEKNYYRVEVKLNQIMTNANSVFNDEFNNGNRVTNTLIVYSELAKSGDVISVEFQCIDRSVYEFYNSLRGIRGPGGSSSPANPYTNLTGTLLGIFSAHTVEKFEYIVP